MSDEFLQWGPGLISRERTTVVRIDSRVQEALQWGPGLISRERQPGRERRRGRVQPSMGPGIDLPGKEESRRGPAPERVPSMGPGIDLPGKIRDKFTGALTAMNLQWGPGLISRESRRRRVPARAGIPPFNGARD